MFKLHKLFASSAIALGLALTATVATAVNPIINGDFKQLVAPGDDYGKVVGWTFTPYVNPPRPIGGFATDTLFQSEVYDFPAVPAKPFTHAGVFDCLYNCKSDRTQSISQLLTGLEQNKTYTISFWIQGYANGLRYGGSVPVYPPIPPFVVSLGSQTAPPILLPANYLCFNSACADWVKKSVTFTYTDPGSSALLTFTQHMSGTYLPKGTIPPETYYHSHDRVYLHLDADAIAEEAQVAPILSVQKALSGNRGADTDQFTVQILKGGTVVNPITNSTTSGSGSTVTGGTTGSNTLLAGTSYTIAEVGSGNTNLGGYSSTLACTNANANANANGTSVPTALNMAFTLSSTDTVSCTITNKVKPATLAVRQMVSDPLPGNIVAPFTFNYLGTNGWPAQLPVTNPAKNRYVTSAAQTLSAFNTDTTVGTTLPDERWKVNSVFGCLDTTSAASGNPSTNLVTGSGTSVTIPASYVRPGANLRCTIVLGHTVP